MKFITGFAIGSISGIAFQLFQNKNYTTNPNNTKILSNIKDIKDSFVELSTNLKVVPEVLNGIQNDISSYTEDIRPDVENIQSSITELQDNLNKMQDIGK